MCNKENQCVAVAKLMLSAVEISVGANFVRLLRGLATGEIWKRLSFTFHPAMASESTKTRWSNSSTTPSTPASHFSTPPTHTVPTPTKFLLERYYLFLSLLKFWIQSIELVYSSIHSWILELYSVYNLCWLVDWSCLLIFRRVLMLEHFWEELIQVKM